MKAENKLDINQVTTMSRGQEKSYRSDHRICETTEHGFTSDRSTQMDSNYLMRNWQESNRLETIGYLATSVFTGLVLTLGFDSCRK